MLPRKQFLNLVIGLGGYYIMQRGFGEAQNRALQEKPVSLAVALAFFGLVIALVSTMRFLYFWHKDHSYSDVDTLDQAYKAEKQREKRKIQPAFLDQDEKAQKKSD